MSTDINNADPVALVVAPPVAGKKGRRKGGLLWLLNARLAVGLVILLVMGLGSFILPLFAPADPSLQATYMRNLPMSNVHWLGTNSLGQDIFWFLVFAIKNSLMLGVLVAVGVTIVATIVGLSAGYIGGAFERVVMLFVDTFITIPLLPILIILGALIRGNTSFFTVGLIIIIFGWAWDARTVRAMALSLREREFINMARFSGANTIDILAKEIFPYVSAYILVGFINTVLFAINTEATLAVIGLSKVEVPTLGSIIFWALSYNALFTGQYAWIVAPIIATVTLFLGLFLTSTGFNQAFASRRGVS
ncbi:ABC transporter permease [Devosia submarina]|uniref:ABC transporter permease n=1 Tax=Devosia submarina TaxID=1173082 RepID=UPI000D3447A0|nr:ABC transporter permease [Devosia submarina]